MNSLKILIILLLVCITSCSSKPVEQAQNNNDKPEYQSHVVAQENNNLPSSFTFNTTQFQPQSRPYFCQIHSGNVNAYVSQYNMIDKSSNTPLRPFIQSARTYQINEKLAATPLFYTAFSDGTVVSAFQLMGVMGNLSIGDRDVVTQHIKQDQIGSYAQIIGYCINGAFVVPKQQEVYETYKLPLETQQALQEARFGATGEQIMNLAR